VGNVVGHEHLYYTDVTFARRLWKQDAVLWWAPCPRLDLGGREMDVHTHAEGRSSLELSFPGCYSNACLSIQAKGLAVNSIMQAALVNELEGSGRTTAFDSTGHTIDEYSKGETQSAVTLGNFGFSGSNP